jgi:hypothetical protein
MPGKSVWKLKLHSEEVTEDLIYKHNKVIVHLRNEGSSFSASILPLLMQPKTDAQNNICLPSISILRISTGTGKGLRETAVRSETELRWILILTHQFVYAISPNRPPDRRHHIFVDLHILYIRGLRRRRPWCQTSRDTKIVPFDHHGIITLPYFRRPQAHHPALTPPSAQIVAVQLLHRG